MRYKEGFKDLSVQMSPYIESHGAQLLTELPADRSRGDVPTGEGREGSRT